MSKQTLNECFHNIRNNFKDYSNAPTNVCIFAMQTNVG